MVEDLFLHIGHPKTGTGSIQQTFRASAATLEAAGVHYHASAWNHRLISRGFSARGKDDARAQAFVEALLHGLDATRAPVALVSAETLVRLSDEAAGRLVERLGAHARRVTVVMYVRHPVSVASSFAHEAVRIGKPLADVAAAPRVLPLRALAERWERASGGRLVIRPFARSLLAKGDAVDDLLALMGRPELGDKLTRVRLNDPLSALGIVLLDIAHRRGRLPRRATRLFERIGGPRYVLPAEALADVRARSAGDLAFLKARFGLDLPEPREVPTPPPHLGEGTLALLAGAMRRIALARLAVLRAAESAAALRSACAPRWRGDGGATGQGSSRRPV